MRLIRNESHFGLFGDITPFFHGRNFGTDSFVDAVNDRDRVFSRFTQQRTIPSLQAGFSFYRHDGNYQASNGDIVDVNRSSFQFGLGSGATGAGTTPRPGFVAQFHLKDALFQPDIARKTAWAQGHAANGVYQKQLLDVSLAYLNLLAAEQDLVILEASRKRTADLAQLTEDFAATGQGLRADADRMKTELVLSDSQIAEVREQSEVASSRLARTLSIDAARRIIPLDPSVVPIQLVSLDHEKTSLISRSLLQMKPRCDSNGFLRTCMFIDGLILNYSKHAITDVNLDVCLEIFLLPDRVTSEANLHCAAMTELVSVLNLRNLS